MKKQKIRGLRFGYVKFSGIGGYSEKMITELLENGVAIRGVEIRTGKYSARCRLLTITAPLKPPANTA